MKKILNIITGIKGENSFSTKLANAIVAKAREIHPDSEIMTRDLSINPLPHLDGLQFTSFNTPEAGRTLEQKEVAKDSDEAVKQLLDADIIVIGIGLYNFGIPSTLKSWIDNISRPGITFSYADGYPKGLLIGKKVYLAIATGGIYSEGPMIEYDFTENYLRKILGFMGLTDVTVLRVEGTMMPDLAENALSKVVGNLEELVH